MAVWESPWCRRAPIPPCPTTGEADRDRGTPGSDDGGERHTGSGIRRLASGKSGVAGGEVAPDLDRGERDVLRQGASRTRPDDFIDLEQRTLQATPSAQGRHPCPSVIDVSGLD